MKMQEDKIRNFPMGWFFEDRPQQKDSFLKRKLILWSEKLKPFHSGKKETHLSDKNKTIMFMVHTNAVMGEKIDRIQSVVDAVNDSGDLQAYISVVSPLSHHPNLSKYENLIYPFIDSEIKKKAREFSDRCNSEGFFQSKEMIYLIALYYETYRKIMQEKNISVLCIYSPAGILTRCSVAAAKSFGIKVLLIPHGLSFPRGKKWIKDIFYAVEGEGIKEDLVEIGENPSNIFVTGAVFMDGIEKYNKVKGIENNLKRILFLPTTPVEDSQLTKAEWIRYIEKYLDALSKVNAEVIVKPKAREKDKFYDKIIKKRNYKNISVNLSTDKDSLYGLIRESDLVVTFYSTTIVESILIGTPVLVIYLIFTGVYDPMVYNEKIIHIEPNDDLEKKIKELFDGDNLKSVIENEKNIIGKYLHPVGGNAGKRTVGVIRKLCKK